MEVPRPGVESEIQLPAFTTATATRDLSRVFDLYHNSWQSWIPNPLSEARDQTRNLMAPSRVRFCCATMRTPIVFAILVEVRLLKRPRSMRTVPPRLHTHTHTHTHGSPQGSGLLFNISVLLKEQTNVDSVTPALGEDEASPIRL